MHKCRSSREGGQTSLLPPTGVTSPYSDPRLVGHAGGGAGVAWADSATRHAWTLDRLEAVLLAKRFDKKATRTELRVGAETVADAWRWAAGCDSRRDALTRAACDDGGTPSLRRWKAIRYRPAETRRANVPGRGEG